MVWPTVPLAIRIVILTLLFIGAAPFVPLSLCASVPSLYETIQTLSQSGDRTTGAPGCDAAADYIESQFTALGLESVGIQRFSLPVRRFTAGAKNVSPLLTLPGKNIEADIHPLIANAISPGTIPEEGIEGRLVYVGRGELRAFDGKEIRDAVILMEMDSGRNWLHAVNLGAAALVYIDRGEAPAAFFRDKEELTPVSFPRFWLDLDSARNLFGDFETAADGRVAEAVKLQSDIRWMETTGRNIYGLIPGADEALRDELLIVEAFYDSSGWVGGRSPGADQALSVATLLDLADHLTRHPPGRSVLLTATGGHAQGLTGTREMFWALTAKSDALKAEKATLEEVIEKAEGRIATLERALAEGPAAVSGEGALKAALEERIKTDVDILSRRLMRLRIESGGQVEASVIDRLAEKRIRLRRLGWRPHFKDLTDAETAALRDLIPLAVKDHEALRSDARRQKSLLKEARAFRSLVRERDVAAVVSLHLSSHGDGIGAFNRGWLYDPRERVDRIGPYSILDDVIRSAGKKLPDACPLHDTLRPSRRRPWDTYLPDHPALGGEVSSMAGYVGVTLATVNDVRNRWGTPHDRHDAVDLDYARTQRDAVRHLVDAMARADRLRSDDLPRKGISTVTGRVNLLRQGELFADQAAGDVMILAFQGPGRYHVRTDARGVFRLKGMASKKLTLHKVIIEGYKFDPKTGKTVLAIDKPGTGKSAYRVKMKNRDMETDLVMFSCRRITLTDMLEPRTFRYMTKIELIDARREAEPPKYWYSRIDTRESTLLSIYLEPGTRLKLTLSDTMLKKKMILTNGDPDRPEGIGYQVDRWDILHETGYRAAWDMWALLKPRIRNLESKGIYNERIRDLWKEGDAALAAASAALREREYSRFVGEAARSWALASRVYDHVEGTQKDVLFGVLFYIALFVPFAFCAERLLFSYTDIHKRIVAFLAILVLLIAVIYRVHPAFELAYSPLVVVLAFFIMGLSLLVTLIVFFRFENEITRLQQRAQHVQGAEVSRWKAFTAAFFLGVSNLRRRRIRTALTCITLIILTFTIMSFTTVKSMRHHARLQFKSETPYPGFLIKNPNWTDLPPESLDMVRVNFGEDAAVAPRAWLEGIDRTRPLRTPVQRGGRSFHLLGLVGLTPEEPRITGLDKTLVGGRWFREADERAILLPRRVAEALGIDPETPGGMEVDLWGTPFSVVGVFSGDEYGKVAGLDDEPVTPVTFPSEVSVELTEVEMDAMESGADIQTFQSRYQHVEPDLMAILPYRTLLAHGGSLKGIVVRTGKEGQRDRGTKGQRGKGTEANALEGRDIPAQGNALGTTQKEDSPEGASHTSPGQRPGNGAKGKVSTSSADGVDNRRLARQLSDRFGLMIFSGEGDGTYIYNASDTFSYSGVPNIAIPLIISIFIVLNTMIGSVYERKREIGIYTSVGLAPSHVSFLFIAESMAFAVLSVVLGYLVAQVSASLFAETPLWAGITVNYSSLAGVGAMILVMLVVLISVIYPSKVAADIAIPDVNRAWTLPAPENGTLSIQFPFLMKRGEQASMAGFLLEYFRDHRDISHGRFSTGSAVMEQGCAAASAERPDDPECLVIRVRVWLAPFDFGIMQSTALRFRPDPENPGYVSVEADIERESGEESTWVRLNRPFLHELRKQLLLWRSMDAEAHRRYAEVAGEEKEKGTGGQRDKGTEGQRRGE